ncbi:E3 ubiquitin-protein ligase TRIM69-like [Pristis pectinata]|uniref:E3 ubiquitin-protein ligase TRIM69-like n=1 Tax=Pristis pectinata TaxID=685728 RepID=UPI00223D96B3|nr:E3 ubiquitin-protein ligase TRIM69-like [Pristis pectinata]
MSGWMLAEGLTSEVTCPVCRNLFRDPVRLECEHNFCRPCIGGLWGELETGFSCPECRETFPQLRLKSNRLLANIVERVRQLRLDVGGPGERGPGPGLCPRHDEKLKLYCQDDREALCVVCGVSKEHKDHRIVPLHEALQFCQEKLKESSVELAKQVETLSGIEASQEKKILELKSRPPHIKASLAETGCQQVPGVHLTPKEGPLSLLPDFHVSVPLGSGRFTMDQRAVKQVADQAWKRHSQISSVPSLAGVPWEKTAALGKRIVSELDLLRQFLQREQDGLLDQLREEEGRVLRQMEDTLRRARDERTALESEMADVQQRLCEEEPARLLQDVKELTERVRQSMLDWEVVPESRLNIGPFQGPLQYAVWKRMRDIISPGYGEKRMRGDLMETYKIMKGRDKITAGRLFPLVVPAPLTLDPGSANPYLILSEDLTAAKYSYTSQQLPENLERFNFCACVLASEGFSSGQHYWEVEVGNQPDWDVGVAAESIDREGWVILTPENGFWTFGHVEHPRIGVYLDHEAGQVSFYRADNMGHLHTFIDTFTERLFPFFYPSADSNAQPLKLCHQHL